MPDEKAEAVATYARGREDAPAAPRQPDRVRRNQLLWPRRSTALREPRSGASRRHGPTGKLTSAALRGLATTGQERCFSAPARRLRINQEFCTGGHRTSVFVRQVGLWLRSKRRMGFPPNVRSKRAVWAFSLVCLYRLRGRAAPQQTRSRRLE
jgi:hypothetical protein